MNLKIVIFSSNHLRHFVNSQMLNKRCDLRIPGKINFNLKIVIFSLNHLTYLANSHKKIRIPDKIESETFL